MKKLVFLVMLWAGLGCTAQAQTSYPSVSIGKQVWMKSNLDVDRFQNGDPIPQAKTDEEWQTAGNNRQPAWCYYNNDPENGKTFGKLYNWYAVTDSRGLAPKGWHVPSDAEWTTLTDFLGEANAAGSKMKSTSGWEKNGNGTNESEFTALPGGIRNGYGNFSVIGKDGCLWSSTAYNADRVWYRSLYYGDDYVGNGRGDKKSGFSVRCIRD